MSQVFYAWPHDEKSEVDAAVLAQMLREAFKKTGTKVDEDEVLQAARLIVQSPKVEFTFNKQ